MTKKIKAIEREQKRHKQRYGMQVDGSGVRRVQLDLIQRRAKRPKPAAQIDQRAPANEGRQGD